MNTSGDQSNTSKAEHSENLHPYQPLAAILLVSMLVFAGVLLYPSKVSEQFNFPSLSLWQADSETSLLPESSGQQSDPEPVNSSSFMADEQVNLAQLLLELAKSKNTHSSNAYSKPMGRGA